MGKQNKQKKKYLIRMAQIDWSKNRWVNKGPGWLYLLYGVKQYPYRKGWIPLWDRNDQRFYWFKIIEKAQNCYGYIVERYPNFGAYWKNTIKEIDITT